jgi:predicted nucleic acid-binding protein
MSTFCLDTDVFIDATKIYPRDVFRRVWETLETWADEDRIIAPEEVLGELERVDDDTSQWARRHKHIFKARDETVQTALAGILERFPGIVRPDDPFPSADAWVVAQAKARDAIVVTKENPSRGPGGAPKIPDVCRELGVPCMKLLDLIREMNLGY